METVLIILYDTLKIFFKLYAFLLLAKIVLSWLPNNIYHPLISKLNSLTEPYLNIFRSLPLNFGGMDFSPIIAFFALNITWDIFSSIFYVPRHTPFLLHPTLVYIFKAFYLLLLLRSATNLLKLKQKQLHPVLETILKLFESLTFPLIKPFQNILDFSYDFSAVLSIIVLMNIVEPVAYFIYNIFVLFL